MDKITISTFQFFKMFPDAETARKYIEARLWPDGVVCPFCKETKRITTRKNGYYRCNACKQDFTVRTNNAFGRSHVPLHKWLYAMYLLVTARKGISSLQLSKELEITQKSAWFLLQRIREACGNDLIKLQGTVAVDELYIGGLEKNKHENKKLHQGRGFATKQPVIAMRERNGRTVAKPIEIVNVQNVKSAIRAHVQRGSTIHSDEHPVYKTLDPQEYPHETVNHFAGEYARGEVTTNNVESVFAVMRRGLHGVYHHASEKHLNRYISEFTFRLNDGNVKRHTLDRLESLVKASAGQRITYSELIQ